MPIWNAELYLQFGRERTQPAIDLANRVELPAPGTILDLGCGPGNSTQVVRRKWPQANVVGLDNSASMLAAARKTLPDTEFIRADLAGWTPTRAFDLVFSNAVLQWIPQYGELIPRLLEQAVADGGALAIQMPAHYDSRLHLALVEVSNEAPWRTRLESARNSLTKETPEFYYDRLAPLVAQLDIWQTEYQHVLDDAESVVAWYRGTGMRPYLESLSTEEQADFQVRVLEHYRRAFPRRADGRVLFPFRRLFLIAYR